MGTREEEKADPGLQAGKQGFTSHLISIHTPSLSCTLLTIFLHSLPIPHCSFIFSYISFFQISPFPPLSYFSILFPFLPSALTSSFLLTCSLPNPSFPQPEPPGLRRGPEPTKEPSEAKSPLSAEHGAGC